MCSARTFQIFSKYNCIWFSMSLRRFENHTWACSQVATAWAQLGVYRPFSPQSVLLMIERLHGMGHS